MLSGHVGRLVAHRWLLQHGQARLQVMHPVLGWVEVLNLSGVAGCGRAGYVVMLNLSGVAG